MHLTARLARMVVGKQNQEACAVTFFRQTLKSGMLVYDHQGQLLGRVSDIGRFHYRENVVVLGDDSTVPLSQCYPETCK